MSAHLPAWPEDMAGSMGVACPPLTRLAEGTTNTALTGIRGFNMPPLGGAICRFVQDRPAVSEVERKQTAE